ncbi:MAG TPA: hypothetical protein VI278_18440 [Nitrososphaeraceae archaeon]|jgi:hypothetical protein
MYENHPSFELPENSQVKTIWRYMDLPKFISLIDRKSLFFTKASKFPDPYEGTIPKHDEVVRRTIYEQAKPQFESEEQFNSFIRTVPEIFGSVLKQYRELMLINSWHLSDYESAALWELYGTETGIAIQSTINELKDSFARTDDIIWIGKVNYIDFNHDWMNEWNILEAFVIKRPSFFYEAEIRAITCLPDNHIGKKVFSKLDMEGEKKPISRQHSVDQTELTTNGKYVKVDLEKLINRVYLSPAAPSYFRQILESIIAKYGLDKEIIKSDLYTLR